MVITVTMIIDRLLLNGVEIIVGYWRMNISIVGSVSLIEEIEYERV